MAGPTTTAGVRRSSRTRQKTTTIYDAAAIELEAKEKDGAVGGGEDEPMEGDGSGQESE